MKQSYKIILVMALACMLSSGVEAQALRDSLQLEYRMDGNAIDFSGKGNDGFVVGATPDTDRFGNAGGAYYFDGTNDYIAMPVVPELQPQLPITMSFWVKPQTLVQTSNGFIVNDYTQDVYHGVHCLLDAGGNGRVSTGFGDGGTGFNSTNRSNKISQGSITAGNWSNITVVIRGQMDMDIYIGCQDAGGNYSGTGGAMAYSGGNPGRIGHSSEQSSVPIRFQGSMDDFAFWNRALSPAEVMRVCEGELTGPAVALDNQPPVRVYPSIARTRAQIDLNPSLNGPFRLEVYSSDGQEAARYVIEDEHHFTMQTSEMAAGMYLLRVFDDENLVSTRKLVVQR